MSFEILHTTIADDAKDISLVDIVAIHGLAESADETWTHANTGINWLRDYLPSAAKGALRPRIFSYRYKADISILLSTDGANNILQQAHTLVTRLQAERSLSDTSKRPLIFICHGMGGIIVKRALAFSATQVSNKVTHNYSIYISTFGIIFLGTPHHGMESAGLQSMAQTHYAPNEITVVMTRHHEILQNITDQFAPLVKQFHVFFFWEQTKTQFKYESSYVVREDSAAPLWDDTERSAIRANHSQMCKFNSENSSEYRTILDALLRYSRVAQASIAARWQNAEKYLATQRSIEATELVGFDVHKNNRPFVYLNSPRTAGLDARKLQNKYFHVPHNVSNIFTGQGQLYVELRQKMLMPQKRDLEMQKRVFVLYGLGGSGKTQFCLKFIQDHRDNFWAIFWVDASSIETAERALSHIGKVGGLGENHLAGMYWLTGLDMPWMLVIDNADDPSVDYSRFFPGGAKGYILMTSRLQDCKIHATVGYHEFRNMEEEDAITLLLRAADEDINTEDRRKVARPIVKALGYLPLALTQAGASIRQNICTLEGYLDLYGSHESELMKRRLAQSSDSYQYSIYTTWEVTVGRIEKENSETAVDAIQILQILAFLHFEQVPISIFERAWDNIQRWPETLPPIPIASKIVEECSQLPGLANQLKKLFPMWFLGRQRRLPVMLLGSSSSWNAFRFREALVMLKNHSLIYRDSGEEETYSMHPMVHSWARDRLQLPDQKIWSDLAINTIAASITPDLDATQQQYRIALIPHITACLKGKYSKSLLKGMESDYQVSKTFKFAGVYSDGGNWKEASRLQERIIEIRMAATRSPGPDTLDVMIALADSYWNLDQLARSLQLLSEVVEISVSTFGEEDSKALRAKDRLAGTLWLCGQRKEAKKLSEEAVSGLKKVLSPDHPHTLDAMDNLGRTLMHLGRAREASELHKVVLDGREKMLGLSHPDTLMAMANLGMSYRALKDFDRAEELLEIVFHERSRILGEDHAYTLWAINDLSKIRCDRGRPVEAETMLTGILATVVRTLGEHHIGMSMTKHNLALAYMAQERWADGQRLLLELIEIQKQKMPARHPDRIWSAMDLAKVTKHLGHLDEAELMFRNTIDLSTEVHGAADARTRNAKGQLSAIYIAQGPRRKFSFTWPKWVDKSSENVETSIEKTRNIGIIAHIDAGKTTTTERMLYYSGHTRRIGNVDDGSTVTDFLPAERARGVTIQSAAITFQWPPLLERSDQVSKTQKAGTPLVVPRSQTPHTINLIDTPGHADFTFEVLRSLRILDGAVCILDGVAGVEAQTEKVWQQAAKYNIPKVIYVNKLDRDGAAFGKTVKEIALRLHTWPAVCQIPWWEGGKGRFTGVGDVVGLRAYRWPDSGDGKTTEVVGINDLPPTDAAFGQEIRKARVALVELLSEHDDVMVEKYLESDEDHLAISEADLTASLRRCVLAKASKIVPVFAGASFRNIGVQPLLDAVVELLPNPTETPNPEVTVGNIKGTLAELLDGKMLSEPAEPPSKLKKEASLLCKRSTANVQSIESCALAFKVVHDPRRGALVYVRVYSGSIRRNALLFNTNLQLSERAPRLLKMYASESIEVPEIPAGQIGVIPGLKHARTGDTLISYTAANPKTGPPAPLNSLQLRPIEVPPAVFFSSIESHSLGEEKSVADALALLIREDPSLQLSVDEDSGQTLLNGMGEFHLEIARDRLIQDLKAKASMGKIEIAYREAILIASTPVLYNHDHETAGRKGKASCIATVKPLATNSIASPTREGYVYSCNENGNEISISITCAGDSNETDEAWEGVLPSHLPISVVQTALKNGALSALGRGIDHGFALHSTHVSLTVDPSTHIYNAETTPAALSSAARLATKAALKESAQQGGSTIMEMVMNVTVSTDDASLGAVVNDISSSRGGHIISLDDADAALPLNSNQAREILPQIDIRKVYAPPDPFAGSNAAVGPENGMVEAGTKQRSVRARVPLKEMIGYLKHLRSMTSGRGTFVMNVDRFERVVGQRKQVLLKELRGF